VSLEFDFDYFVKTDPELIEEAGVGKIYIENMSGTVAASCYDRHRINIQNVELSADNFTVSL